MVRIEDPFFLSVDLFSFLETLNQNYKFLHKNFQTSNWDFRFQETWAKKDTKELIIYWKNQTICILHI